MSPPAVDLGALTTIADAIAHRELDGGHRSDAALTCRRWSSRCRTTSPFVDAGARRWSTLEAIGPALQCLLYDRERRERLTAARRAFITRYGLVADGGAAGRAADLIVGLTKH
jgi:hypothetical protein